MRYGDMTVKHNCEPARRWFPPQSPEVQMITVRPHAMMCDHNMTNASFPSETVVKVLFVQPDVVNAQNSQDKN